MAGLTPRWSYRKPTAYTVELVKKCSVSALFFLASSYSFKSHELVKLRAMDWAEYIWTLIYGNDSHVYKVGIYE